jgi:hypothetical protein
MDTQGLPSRRNMSHASPSDVLSHNTAIAGKIQTLTGQDAQAACADWSGDLPLCPQFGSFGLPATKQITWPNVPYERPDTW